MNKVVHFEIPADDLGRARNFYGEVFGWDANDVPEMEYTLVNTGPADEQGNPDEAGYVNGGLLQRNEALTSPIITIGVEDIDAAAEQVEANGGRITVPKMQAGDMGFSAYFEDTEGNLIGLWESAA